MARRVSKASLPTSCPRCNSVQRFALKTREWHFRIAEGEFERYFEQYVQCSMCRMKISIRKGTLKWLELFDRYNRVSQMKRRGRRGGKILVIIAREMREEEQKYEQRYPADRTPA